MIMGFTKLKVVHKRVAIRNQDFKILCFLIFWEDKTSNSW